MVNGHKALVPNIRSFAASLQLVGKTLFRNTFLWCVTVFRPAGHKMHKNVCLAVNNLQARQLTPIWIINPIRDRLEQYCSVYYFHMKISECRKRKYRLLRGGSWVEGFMRIRCCTITYQPFLSSSGTIDVLLFLVLGPSARTWVVLTFFHFAPLPRYHPQWYYGFSQPLIMITSMQS